jgi:ribonucleoside-diphosphate reductase alpha chain
VIKSSNLCAEIIEFSSPDETAVCNLASVALPKMVVIPTGKVKSKDKELRSYDFDKLYDVTYQAGLNLDKVIDVNFYPVKETKTSNFNHRPIGIGVQGLADVFQMMGLPFESPEARVLNFEIAETMYFAALTVSNDLAKARYKFLKEGLLEGDKIPTTAGAYSSFEGSPLSRGEFQFNLWGMDESRLSTRLDWEGLRKSIIKYGVRNSLSLAMMPTASTSQILGNNECFEAYTSNLYKRNVLGGEYIILNKHMVSDLVDLNLWNDKIINDIILNEGSVQGIQLIPTYIQELYKTTWEMKGSKYIDLVADRGLFTCQSQSMNLFLVNVNIKKLNKAHFYGWKSDGIKTGMYYLRSTTKVSARKALAVDTSVSEEVEVEVIKDPAPITEPMKVIETESTDKIFSAAEALQCSIDNPDDCEACGS